MASGRLYLINPTGGSDRRRYTYCENSRACGAVVVIRLSKISEAESSNAVDARRTRSRFPSLLCTIKVRLTVESEISALVSMKESVHML